MKIFISDLHISSPLFKKDKDVIDLFNDPKVEEVYILGDLLDTWEQNPYKTAEKKKDFIYELNQSEKLKVILRGNHDPEIPVMREIFPNTVILDQHIMTLFGKKTILIHGHTFDEYVTRNKPLFFIHYLGERVGLNLKGFFRTRYYNLVRFINDAPKNSLVLKTEKAIVEKYTNEFDLIICGHTHVPKLVRLESIDYVNCGCVIYKSTYAVADKNTMLVKRF